MKKVSVFIASLLTIFLVTSCSEEFTDSSDLSVKKGKLTVNYTVDEWPADLVNLAHYTLVGGKTIVTGTVVVGEDNEFVYVKYAAEDGFLLTETHLYLGDVATILMKNGGPKIGQFPYASENPDGDKVIIHKIPKSELVLDSEGNAYAEGACFEIAAHAVTVGEEDGIPVYKYDSEGNIIGYAFDETSWAKQSGGVFVLKSIMDGQDGSVPTWAATANTNDGIVFDLETAIGQNISMWEHNFSYVAGNALVELDGDVIRFTVTSNYGMVYWSFMFIGSMEELNSINRWNGYEFPYSIMETTDKHVFEFPVSILGSELVFDGPRWGFYVEYCPTL